MLTKPRAQMMIASDDRGETLIEIVLTVIITSLTITALISSLATAGNAGNAQRGSVRADVVMRNYAEATKAAAQSCLGGAKYTVVYAPPPGYTVMAAPSTGACPEPSSTQLLTLQVLGPQGFHQQMQIKLRTP